MRRADFGVYPALEHWFGTVTALAAAGCMAPRRAYDCLRDIKSFKTQEKQAIVANIVFRMDMAKVPEYDRQRQEMYEAFYDFDKIFRSEVA